MGHEILVVTDKGENYLLGERIDPNPIPESWRKWLGELETTNPDDFSRMCEDLRLREEKGLLLLSYKIPGFQKEENRVWFIPISDTEAIIPGLGRGMGETIQALKINGEEQLRYSGYNFRKREND